MDFSQQRTIDVERQCAAVAIRAQMVDGQARPDMIIGLHRALAKQSGLTSIKDSDSIIAVTADDEKVIIAACITTDQSDAILVRAPDLTGVRLDAHIAEILVRFRAEIDLQSVYQNSIATAIVIHHALRRFEAIPSAARRRKIVL